MSTLLKYAGVKGDTSGWGEKFKDGANLSTRKTNVSRKPDEGERGIDYDWASAKSGAETGPAGSEASRDRKRVSSLRECFLFRLLSWKFFFLTRRHCFGDESKRNQFFRLA